MYGHVLNFLRDHLIKERIDAEDKDVVMIMVVEGVDEENPLGFLSQTLVEDSGNGCPHESFKCEKGIFRGHIRHEGQYLEIEE
eukprot:4731739-Ditylum_brightwellii.AAC.1